MDLSKLEKILKSEPAYRLKQARELVFKNLIEDWQEAKSLPVELRQKLNDNCSLATAGEIFSLGHDVSKARLTLGDGFKIETVLMRHQDGRQTVCASSQVGCSLGCLFCATGQAGFKRNLTVDEIVEQVLFWARRLKKTDLAPIALSAPAGLPRPVGARNDHYVTNVVFMGMGEPFLNYDNVLAAIRIFNDSDGLNIGARHISISTCGIIEGIKKLAEEKLQINLAISLHAPADELRSQLMPINEKYSLRSVLKAVDDYIAKTKRRVMFEYVLLKGINDSDQQARQLARLLRQPLYFVNLIVYNPTGQFKPPIGERIKRFKEILKNEKIEVVQRYRFGSSIDAACGQLVGERDSFISL